MGVVFIGFGGRRRTDGEGENVLVGLVLGPCKSAGGEGREDGEVGMLSMRIFLLQYDAQSSGSVRFCKPAEMFALCHSGLPMKRSVYIHPFNAN